MTTNDVSSEIQLKNFINNKLHHHWIRKQSYKNITLLEERKKYKLGMDNERNERKNFIGIQDRAIVTRPYLSIERKWCTVRLLVPFTLLGKLNDQKTSDLIRMKASLITRELDLSLISSMIFSSFPNRFRFNWIGWFLLEFFVHRRISATIFNALAR